LLFSGLFVKFIIMEDNQKNMINYRVRKRILSSDNGCSLLKMEEVRCLILNLSSILDS
jgi:hypothetical protein